MTDLDAETVERVARWCAEAGRQTTAAEIRSALGALGWDELLAAKALLADPPPARPLGPYALADLARGVPAHLAAERERSDRYPRGPGPGPSPAPSPEPAAPRPATAKGARRSRRATVLVRKPVPAAAPPAPPALPLFDELLLPAGRALLEQLMRRHGGRRPAFVAALAASHRRADAQPIGDADLDRLLDLHGLTRAFQRREQDETLHAVRAAGGVLGRAAAALGLDAAGLGAALDRLELRREVERIRGEKRRELEGRATLSDRARLLLADPERLQDLGLLGALEADLRARLPELLRALRAGAEPLAIALARSLSLPVPGVRELAERLGIDVGPVSPHEARAGEAAPPRFRAERPDRPGRGAPGGDRRGPPRDRPGAPRPPRGDRPARSGPASDARPRPDRRDRDDRPPRGDRPARSDRPGRFDRPAREDRPPRFDRPPRAGGSPEGKQGGERTPRYGRPARGAPSSRPAPSSGPGRPGARSSGPRPGGQRPSGPRPAGVRPGGPGRPTRPSGPGRSPGRPGGRRPSR